MRQRVPILALLDMHVFQCGLIENCLSQVFSSHMPLAIEETCRNLRETDLGSEGSALLEAGRVHQAAPALRFPLPSLL